MPIPHFAHLRRHRSAAQKRRDRMIAAILVPNIIAIGVVLWWFSGHGYRKPPNIFDTPVDDVSAYLASKDFNALSTQQRLEYIQGMLKRFNSMKPSDSAVAAAFFAGLSGKTSEQLMNNARTLGKDILIEGARDYLALATDQEKAAFIDQWVVKWVRFADQMGGRNNAAARSDQDILNRLSTDARRDVQRNGGEVKPFVAQQVLDFWQRDVASVASPKEQGQIFAFLPAVRDHMLQRGK